MVRPSKLTPAKDLRKFCPMEWVDSEPKVARGMGDSAANKYILKKRPMTVSSRVTESTTATIKPISPSRSEGICDSGLTTAIMVEMILSMPVSSKLGAVTPAHIFPSVRPLVVNTLVMSAPVMANIPFTSFQATPMAYLERMNRTNSLKTCSGRFSST